MNPQLAVALAQIFVLLSKEIPSIVEILKSQGGNDNEELIKKIREAQADLPEWI